LQTPKSEAEFADLLDDVNFLKKHQVGGLHYHHIFHGFLKLSTVYLLKAEWKRQLSLTINNKQMVLIPRKWPDHTYECQVL
jgi:hypothetical protein